MQSAYALFEKALQKITFKYYTRINNTLSVSDAIGIRNETPIRALDVSGDIKCENELEISAAVPGEINGLLIKRNNDKTSQIIHKGIQNFEIKTLDPSNIVINPNGNVGIGSSLPTSKLDVNGDMKCNSSLEVSDPLEESGLKLKRNANFVSEISHTGTQDFSIKTENVADLSLGTNNINRFIIKSDGKIGINTTVPAHNLDISGTLKTDDLYANRIYSDNFFVTSDNINITEYSGPFNVGGVTLKILDLPLNTQLGVYELIVTVQRTYIASSKFQNIQSFLVAHYSHYAFTDELNEFYEGGASSWIDLVSKGNNKLFLDSVMPTQVDVFNVYPYQETKTSRKELRIRFLTNYSPQIVSSIKIRTQLRKIQDNTIF